MLTKNVLDGSVGGWMDGWMDRYIQGQDMKFRQISYDLNEVHHKLRFLSISEWPQSISLLCFSASCLFF